ncbi:5-oxoprolinase subunit PxpA [Polaribacter aestuariivivens]|uniref:5-oxoprolinase subunit PxpA n=1 Tax=Polaribacter aestuariivivens TaxID=2304626 RepID=A0A5S3NAL1_9FLAO|nr:5-oxoprolinase subunit PxpA [Polaribacter aestuariivivens]TMM32331.1 5-oxoprolinase subunit PxpA [Polaribacter aestuariivivens]
MKIDINCDVGEGVVNEHLLFPFISSCNIACGGHFGDKNSIDKTIQLAVDNNVKIGAHPSFPDVKNFGRKVMYISDEVLKISIENQMNLFQERLLNFNQKMHHIKPHGALYNLIAKEKKEAEKFIEIIKKYTNNCFLYVPYNSEIEKIALKNNIRIKYEFFADRNYNDDLSLVSRAQKNAIIEKPEDVFKHIFNVLKNGKVLTISGNEKIIQADTFCVHGDHVNSVEILQFINNVLKDKNIKIV